MLIAMRRGFLAPLLVSSVLLIATPAIASAQHPADRLLFDPETGEDHRELIRELAGSSFRLFGEGDRAVTGMRPRGTMEHFTTNTGIIDAADLNLDSQPDLFGCETCPTFQGFDFSPIYAAGRDEWSRFVNEAPSLVNVEGLGYAVSRNFPTLGVREIFASDGQFGVLFSGTTSTFDGSCRDFSSGGPSGNNMGDGLTLLAGSDCPPTWPLVGGEPAFLGDHPVTREAYLASQAALGSEFNFDWWRVDPTLIDGRRRFGHFQTYGAYDDYNSAMIGRFGDVVPGGIGPPRDEGWPLGLRTEFNAFVFPQPTVANTMFWRAIIINRTEDVYGVPLNYEKLYVGYTHQPCHSSCETAFYHQVWRGTLLSVEANTGEPACGGVTPPGAAFIDCQGDIGFAAGADAMVVLKSPIGDLRNVLLTCSPGENPQRAAADAIPCPTDAFNDPANPHAGDTITYNHYTMCPFGPCSRDTLLGPDKRFFGALASNLDLFLDGRDPDSMSARPLYEVTRSPNWPEVPDNVGFWVPGSWDYTANGPTPGGDTIWVPTCYGPPGAVILGTTREDRDDACVVTFADTMPVGEAGNPAYNNQEGNVSYWSVGPFGVAAGDTTALVIAKMSQVDSASFEEELDEIIDLYMKFYLSPAPPPPVTIVGAEIDASFDGGRARGDVTLRWNDASEVYVDPFLDDLADGIETATGGRLGRLKALNPRLPDEIRERARSNLRRILIYKSCGGGRTFTAQDTTARGNLDCDGDPAVGTDGETTGTGWRAYEVLPVDSVRGAPNSFRDTLVLPGQTYLYAVLGESRELSFTVIDSVDTDGRASDFEDVGAVPLSIAPRLINALPASDSVSNAASVYVPVSAQPGAEPAAVAFDPPDPARSSVPFEVTLTGGEVARGRYRAVFANEFIIREAVRASGEVAGVQVFARDVEPVQVNFFTAVDSAVNVDAFTFEGPNRVTLSASSFDDLTVDTVIVAGPDTIVTTLVELGFVLVRSDTDEPLLVSSQLFGPSSQTTPPSFFDRRDTGEAVGFPGFVVDADNSVGNRFRDQTYLASTEEDTVELRASPSVRWNEGSEPTDDTLIESANGVYVISWEGRTFGPGSPFTPTPEQPGQAQAAFAASLDERVAADTARTDSVAFDAVRPFLATSDSLLPARLPFLVFNETYGRAVDVAVRRRSDTTMILGDPATGDTARVTLPEDVWVPGDDLFLLETVELDSIGTSGGIVLDGSGDPIKESRLVATFVPARLDCSATGPRRCNPVSIAVSDTSEAPFISNEPGQILRVDYRVPFSLESVLSFEVDPALAGRDVIDAGKDIRAQMDSIKPVPNPYVGVSSYQQSNGEARVMFSHLPPRGVLRVFTVSGQFVQEVRWRPEDLSGNGDLFWDLKNREGWDVAAGLYVFHVEATNPADGARVTKTGKLVVIR